MPALFHHTITSAFLLVCVSLPVVSPLASAHSGSDTPAGAAPEPAALAARSVEIKVALPNDVAVTINSPQRWHTLVQEVAKEVTSLHTELADRYGSAPQFAAHIRLIQDTTFFALTGAPPWVEAMIYQGQILLPLPSKGAVDSGNLLRSVRHEYTHAWIAALTAGRCIAWLDEGLAQLAEGGVEEASLAALKTRLKATPPLEFRKLRSGFKALPPADLAAAYAQSALAASIVLEQFGAARIRDYFDNMRAGMDTEAAFLNAFMIEQSKYEKELAIQVRAKLAPHAG